MKGSGSTASEVIWLAMARTADLAAIAASPEGALVMVAVLVGIGIERKSRRLKGTIVAENVRRRKTKYPDGRESTVTQIRRRRIRGRR